MEITSNELLEYMELWVRTNGLSGSEMADTLEEEIFPAVQADPELSILVWVAMERIREWQPGTAPYRDLSRSFP